MNNLKKKTIISLIVILTMVFNILPVGVFASSGTGTMADPLIVTTPQELSDALDNKNIEYVKLGSDINLETATIGSWGNRIYVLDNDRIVDLNGYQLTHYGLVIRFYNSPDAGSSYGKLTIKDSSSAGTGKIRTGMGAGINANTFSGAVGPDITHEIIIDDVDFVYAGDDHFSVLGISSTSSPSHKLNCVIKNVNVSLYDNSGEGHLSFVDALESEKNNVTVEIQNSKIESAKTYNSVQKTNNADGLTSVDLSYFVKDTTTIKIDDVEQAHTTDAKTLGKKIEVGNIAQYTVTFDTDGGSTVANQTINAGEKATRPTDPTKTNYTFDDWYTDATYTTKFDFANTTITGDTVIYAKFTPNATTYTITVTNGNSSKASAEKDETITLTANTPEFGKEFDKWVVESGTITLADATSATTTFTMPEENVSVKATYKSTHSTYTVTFESNGGSEVESQTLTGSGVSDSANVTKPTDPTKTGYTFDGWYKDSALTEEFDFFVGITSDLTLYAKWTENSVTPTYTIETGDGQSFTLGDTNDIEIKASGELAKLTEIKVDGTTLASSNYTTASGSTILTLLNSYLNTLSEGNHTVTFVYNDGEVDATLKVLAAQNTSGDDTNTTGDNTNTGTETNNNTTNDSSTGSPQTGDNIVNYVITLILSIIGLAGGSLYLNKKKIFANK